MFFNKELNQISCKKSIPEKQLNAAIDAIGLPYGFQYSKRFLLFGIRWVDKVEKIGDKTYRVPSESKPGKFYNVALDPLSCECPAFRRFKVTPYPFCKHIVAAMVKERDVTDAFFDWLVEKDKSEIGDLDEYIEARFKAGNANTSIIDDESSTPQKSVTVFSSSQLDCYARCPASYYFRYQKRLPDESPLSSSLAFDRCLKATIYARKGYEPDDDIPLEEKWKPELDVAANAVRDGMNQGEVFVETFQWLVNEAEKSVGMDWSDESEEETMLKQGGILVNDFEKEFGDIPAKPLVKILVPMVDKETGEVVQSNGTPASVQCSLDLVSYDGMILKLKTSARSIGNISYDWTLDLQRYAYEQINKESPKECKVVNLVRTKKPKMEVISAPPPRISRTLAICESVIASINASAFYPNPKNLYGCSKCGYLNACENQW